jgi:hypothetical protein
MLFRIRETAQQPFERFSKNYSVIKDGDSIWASKDLLALVSCMKQSQNGNYLLLCLVYGSVSHTSQNTNDLFDGESCADILAQDDA